MPFFLGAAGDPVISQANREVLTTQFSQLSTDLGGWFTSMLPILMSIVGIFILVWLARLGIRLLKSMSNSAK